MQLGGLHTACTVAVCYGVKDGWCRRRLMCTGVSDGYQVHIMMHIPVPGTEQIV